MNAIRVMAEEPTRGEENTKPFLRWGTEKQAMQLDCRISKTTMKRGILHTAICWPLFFPSHPELRSSHNFMEHSIFPLQLLVSFFLHFSAATMCINDNIHDKLPTSGQFQADVTVIDASMPIDAPLLQ